MMKAVISSAIVGAAVASEGGTLKLSWTDCGDSSTHGHITSLSPETITLGTKTALAGKGTVDEAIQGASYKIAAKAGGIPVFSHNGDACKPETIKLPLGLGEIDMKGFSCPLSAGNVELDLDLTLSANIPASMAKTDISLTADASNGDKALCVDIKTSAAGEVEEVEPEVQGGTLKLDFTDCGDSQTHGHITSLTPDSVTLGTKTTLAGKGSVDEAIQGATYKIAAKAGGIPVFSHNGDACKPDTIKLPLGLGEIDMKGFSCPISAGNVELDLDLTLSASIPSSMAKTDISLTADASNGDKALCVDIKTSPAAEAKKIEPQVQGGTLKLDFTDCGDSQTHGHITSLSPDSVTLGTKTTLAGKGSVDEAIQGATYKIAAKAGGIPVFSHNGDACKPDTIKLPLGLGEIDMKGFSCPISAGNVELDLDLTLSANIPASMAKTDISLTAAASNGDKALCVDIKTSPASASEIIV